ncbi:isochorismatase [Dactylonectria estremocensis]|uniref:Isochorismatase n=1 Tax=Dactylonectria estremocensis TaxID=1079267 RepID=A0A9P9DM32_9HYPO|nr:isochorismatase [Dactylonectria estremocensis]
MASPSSFRQILGVPPSTASVKDSTLIIIDAQNEYAEGKLQVSNISPSLQVIASLLEKYRQAKGNVVHVVHVTPDGAPVFTPNTKLAEVLEELTPREGEKIVYKNHPSSFAKTDLEEHLQSISSKKIVLTGYMAHVCVSTTARHGAQLGYDVVVVEDGVGDRDIPGVSAEEVTRVVLAEIGDVFGTIVQSKDIL